MKNFLSQAFGTVFTVSFYVYFYGVIFAVPVFNWQYANTHGLGSWVMLGEVVATAEGVIWPYYMIKWLAVKPNSSETHYDAAKASMDAGLRIIVNRGSPEKLSDQDKRDVEDYLDKAVAEANQIEDGYLDQVHPEFRIRYRRCIQMLSDFSAGLKTGDILKQKGAASQYNEFSEWMASHRDELKFP